MCICCGLYFSFRLFWFANSCNYKQALKSWDIFLLNNIDSSSAAWLMIVTVTDIDQVFLLYPVSALCLFASISPCSSRGTDCICVNVAKVNIVYFLDDATV